jgi:putative ABC transport system permease protein
MKVQFFDIENWKEIGATLAKNKTRTFLTGFGIFWGVFMLACLLGGARGAEDLLRRNFDGFATNSAVLVPGNTTMPYQGHAKGRAWDADLTDLERLRQLIPELDVVTTTVRDNVSLRHDRYSYSSQAWGAQEAFTDVMLPCIENGRFINTADEKLMRKVAVVGKKVANELYPGVVNPVGEQIQINGIVYTIVGIAYQTSEVQLGGRIDDVVIIPLSTFQKAFNLGEKVGMIMVVGNQNANLTLLESKFRHILYSRHQIAPTDDSALWYLNISERFSQLDSLFIGVSFLAGFIGISTLIAGIIGIGNIMWVIVKERTQEFGVRRAIGAKPADVTIQILSEGVTLTAVAGFAGITMACIALGVAQHLTANDISTPQFQMNIWQAGGIILVFAILGTLAGLIPALKAMRIKPIEALNDK